jgi:polar amino acid transport system substrate-binding protein
MRWRSVLFLLVSVLGVPASAAAVALRVCHNETLGGADTRHFSAEQLRHAAAQVPGVVVMLTPLPWSRCLIAAGRGEFDAVLGASHTPERAMQLVFPRDAEGQPDAARRMFHLDILLMRPLGSRVRWDGDQLEAAHRPVGTERGHAAVAFLRDRAIPVDDGHASLHALLAKLRSGRIVAAVINEAQWLSLNAWQPHALDGLERVGPPLLRKPYFLVFARAWADLHPKAADALWRRLAEVRDEPAFQQRFAEQQGWQPGQPLPRP